AAGAGGGGGHGTVLSIRSILARRLILILRSHAKHGVSKDEATASASWFETPRCARLLTMRRNVTTPRRRQRRLDQPDPVRGAVDDRFVIEVVGRVMQAGAVA